MKRILMSLLAVVALTTATLTPKHAEARNAVGDIVTAVAVVAVAAIAIHELIELDQNRYPYNHYYNESRGCYYQRVDYRTEVYSSCQRTGYYGEMRCTTISNTYAIESCGRPFDRPYYRP